MGENYKMGHAIPEVEEVEEEYLAARKKWCEERGHKCEGCTEIICELNPRYEIYDKPQIH